MRSAHLIHTQQMAYVNLDVYPSIIKLEGAGQAYQTITASGVHGSTKFEQVQCLKVSERKKYAKEYGKATVKVLRFCKNASIFGSKRNVIASSWFKYILNLKLMYKVAEVFLGTSQMRRCMKGVDKTLLQVQNIEE